MLLSRRNGLLTSPEVGFSRCRAECTSSSAVQKIITRGVLCCVHISMAPKVEASFPQATVVSALISSCFFIFT